jgi:hypothetical protein
MVRWQIGMSLEDLEKQVILKALNIFQGNRSQVARSLKVAERTIYNKLALYNGEFLVDEELPVQKEEIKDKPKDKPKKVG